MVLPGSDAPALSPDDLLCSMARHPPLVSLLFASAPRRGRSEPHRRADEMSSVCLAGSQVLTWGFGVTRLHPNSQVNSAHLPVQCSALTQLTLVPAQDPVCQARGSLEVDRPSSASKVRALCANMIDALLGIRASLTSSLCTGFGEERMRPSMSRPI